MMAVRFELSSSLGGLRWAACRAYTDEESMSGRQLFLVALPVRREREIGSG